MTENDYNFHNPFIINTPIEAIKLVKNVAKVEISGSNILIENVDDGVYQNRDNGMDISYTNDIDTQHSSKLYRSEVIQEMLYSLNRTAANLVFYILLNIRKEEDTIVLNYKNIMNELNVVEGTYYSAIKELTAKGFIAKKYAKEYWVNPHFIFAGNRPQTLKDKYGDTSVNVKAIVPSKGQKIKK